MNLTAGAAGLLRLDVPVEPDRETAREWLFEELARPEYASDRTLLQRFVDWFLGLFDFQLPGLTMPPLQLALVLVGIVAVVVLIAWWIAGPVRTSRARRPVAAVVDEDDTRTSAQMRAAADAAALAGDWSMAVVERFRAVVRSLEERVVLDPRPGRTAQEAAADAGVRLPALAAGLRRGAGLFDDVEYGKLTARPQDDVALRELDAAIGSARPLAPAGTSAVLATVGAPAALPVAPAAPRGTRGDAPGADR